MKTKLLFLALFLAATGGSLFAQSTTVSGQVTDAGGQSWNSGTITAVFVINPSYPSFPQYTWTGGALNSQISGTLNATGGYSISVPQNSAITPVNSQWRFQICPQASAPCFYTSPVTIAGATQTVNATPPAILINLATATPPIAAYSTSEISGAVIGSSFFLIGTGPQSCSAVSGNSCTTWTSGGGSSTPSQQTDPQFPATLHSWYRMMPAGTVGGSITESASPCTTPADWSGKGNNATGSVGTAPTPLALTGGCQFNANGAILTPSALNGDLTLQALVGFQESQAGSATFNAPILSAMTGNQGVGMFLQACPICNVTGSEVPWTGPIPYDATNGKGTTPAAIINGVAVLTVVFGTGANGDHAYVNGLEVCNNSTFGSAGLMAAYPSKACLGTPSSAGINNQVFQIGGTSNLASSSAYFNGQIYSVATYTSALAAADVVKGQNALIVDATNRGISVGLSPVDTGNHLVCIGDSLTGGGASLANYACSIICPFLTAGSWTCLNLSTGGSSSLGQSAFQTTWQVPEYRKNTAKNAVWNWTGTNDCAAIWPTTPPIDQLFSNYAQQINSFNQQGSTQLFGFDFFIGTMISRTQTVCNSGSCDPCKDVINPFFRQNWQNSYHARAYIDLAMNLTLGADGACTAGGASGKGCADAVHPTQDAEYNIVSPAWLWAINGAYGNWSLSSANTYGAAAVTQAITAASESTNTMTFTVAANAPPAGTCVFISGVTPAGYNTTTGAAGDACSFVLTSNGTTSFTVYNGTTGLGAGTVFGTVASSLQQNTDVFSVVSAAVTDQLPPCWLWPSHNLNIFNSSGGSVTLAAWGSETFVGSTTVATNTMAVLQSQLISQAAAGCKVIRVQ